MGLVRVSNPAKLRKLSARVGQPVIAAFSRFFQDQNTLLAFTDPTTAWIVPREGPIETYDVEPVELLEHGVRISGPV